MHTIITIRTTSHSTTLLGLNAGLIRSLWFLMMNAEHVGFSSPSGKITIGFIIYRTVYTPKSDKEIDYIDGKPYDSQDPFPETIIKETYKSVILEDRER
ncbi:uncharacterized protein N7446_003447 [Penicillium canescens]|uniref:uncharacterized protein n=1 Tax=Penicillium canescens TaxID=5083 RepID=UPI0026E0F3E0|nr:uncharacterized protein N7446_003447 [Penicillium canescens]KAJ6075670.1 hypothetical protein N7446_003447 [Penicillium canescens]